MFIISYSQHWESQINFKELDAQTVCILEFSERIESIHLNKPRGPEPF